MRAQASPKKGFTLVELLISVSIFVVMTVLLIAKYGNFNQSVLLTNLIYDVALVVRTAQTFGLSVANTASQSSSASFDAAYGVDFSVDTTDSANTKVILFTDTSPLPVDGIYTSGSDATISTYNISRGAKVTYLCVGTETTCAGTPPTAGNVKQLDVTFKRPDPTAIICYRNLSDAVSCQDPSNSANPVQYAKIVIVGTDGSPRALEIFRNGQVSIVQ